MIGVPDDKWGEAVKAVVELKAGASATADELIALCKEKLGSVKAPKTRRLLAALPRSAGGQGAEEGSAPALLGRAGAQDLNRLPEE